MSLWIAAHSSGDASPSCLSQHNGFMSRWRSTPFGAEATQAKRWLRCQPRSYLRLEAYSFLGLSGGHRIDPETRCCRAAHKRLLSASILSPNPSMARTDGSPPRHENLGDHLGSLPCSSCLRFQSLSVETFPLLPKCQSNGRDLTRQPQTRHLRLHSLVQQSHLELTERPQATAGSGGRSLEDLFHLVVMILIQTTQLLGFLATLQLSADIAVLRTVVRLNA